MAEYRITWEIDIEAGNPRKAAEEALRIMKDPDSIASVFTVWDAKDNATTIDLLEA